MLELPIAKVNQSLLRIAAIPGDYVLTRALRQVSRGAWATLYHGQHPLCRGRRMSAVGSLWAWQAWRRVIKKPLLVELQTGTKMLCPIWSTVAGAWVSVGAHEFELFFVADISRPGDVFVDVGANIGVYAVTAALRGARSLAFEPTAEARAAIIQNAELNGVSALVSTSEFALSDYEGQARFTVGEDCTNRFADSDAAPGLVVEVKTLDSCLAGLIAPAAGPDLIKIDVEGADDAVLRGAISTLSTHRPTLIVEIWAGGRSIRSFLAGFGYSAYAYDVEAKRLRELPRDHSGEGNLIAIHPDRLASIQGRIQSAPAWPHSRPVSHWRASHSQAPLSGS